MKEKILFLKCGGFSNINTAFLNLLKNEFREYEVETCDVWLLIKRNSSVFFLIFNIYFFFKEYGLDILKGDKKISNCKRWFFATSYISQTMAKLIHNSFAGKKYIFSIQTQSIFNGKIPNTPNYIYTDHTTKTNLSYPGINPKWYMRSNSFIRKCESKIYSDATKIFTCGTLPARTLTQEYGIPKEKIVTIYAGSNLHYKVADKHEKKFTKNILFVGLDWERKGGPVLIEVFKNILLRHPDASLTIVGAKPKIDNLPNVMIVGEVPIKEVRKYYEQATIFMMPTQREPFGMVFIEAMNYQLPIVASNIGCIPDMVLNDFNGYLINNNDVKAYTRTVCTLLDNPQKCSEMGNNSYELANSKFRWDKVGALLKENITCQPALKF